jgi:hypothetical protein
MMGNVQKNNSCISREDWVYAKRIVEIFSPLIIGYSL